jgi:hypothetical protein
MEAKASVGNCVLRTIWLDVLQEETVRIGTRGSNHISWRVVQAFQHQLRIPAKLYGRARGLHPTANAGGCYPHHLQSQEHSQSSQ